MTTTTTSTVHDPGRRRGARFHVRANRMLAWLATATTPSGVPLADGVGLADHDTFRRGGEDLGERIRVLVERAQADAILSAPAHLLTLWPVGEDGFLLTVDAPALPRLCSRHLHVADLLPEQTSGSVAALAVLLAVGQVANHLLDTHHQHRHPTRTNTTPIQPGAQRRQPEPSRAEPGDGTEPLAEGVEGYRIGQRVPRTFPPLSTVNPLAQEAASPRRRPHEGHQPPLQTGPAPGPPAGPADDKAGPSR